MEYCNARQVWYLIGTPPPTPLANGLAAKLQSHCNKDFNPMGQHSAPATVL